MTNSRRGCGAVPLPHELGWSPLYLIDRFFHADAFPPAWPERGGRGCAGSLRDLGTSSSMDGEGQSANLSPPAPQAFGENPCPGHRRPPAGSSRRARVPRAWPRRRSSKGPKTGASAASTALPRAGQDLHSLFVIFLHENKQQGIHTLFPLTYNKLRSSISRSGRREPFTPPPIVESSSMSLFLSAR